MVKFQYISTLVLCTTLTAALSSCDRRQEIPRASSPEACEPRELPAAEDLVKMSDIPVDRVVTFEGMPHPLYFGWTQEGKNRAVSKLLGTERRVLLFQEFTGDTPPTTTKVTGILRRYRDLPANPWEAVKREIKSQYNWEIPEDAYILMEGFQPSGCP